MNFVKAFFSIETQQYCMGVKKSQNKFVLVIALPWWSMTLLIVSKDPQNIASLQAQQQTYPTAQRAII
jgi:hypothetical protein